MLSSIDIQHFRADDAKNIRKPEQMNTVVADKRMPEVLEMLDAEVERILLKLAELTAIGIDAVCC